MEKKDVYIHKDVLGFKHHLVCKADSGEVRKVGEDLPEDAVLVYGDPSLQEISKLYSTPLPPFPPGNHVKALQTVLNSRNVQEVPWNLCMPQTAFKRTVEGLGRTLVERFSTLDLTYYNTHFKRTNMIFSRMHRAKIDPRAWMVHSGNKDLLVPHVFTTFEPDEDGLAPETVYSRCDTKSGRLKVTEGANILLLPKEQRNILGSRFGSKGKIMHLDFAALEPRVMLYVCSLLGLTSNNPSPPSPGNPPRLVSGTVEADLYSLVLKELGITGISREAVKEVILSQLYGASYETILGKLTGIKDAKGFIEAVEDFFGVKALRAHLLKEYEANQRKFIQSFYGRKVDTSEISLYMLLNYFTQPTAVDVAFYGFRNILRELQENVQVIPLFINTDALVLDVHEEALPLLHHLCEVGSRNIPLFPGAIFPLKASRF